MVHPIPQTSDELTRECLGCIWHAAEDLARAAEQQNISGVDVQFEFLKQQVKRLEVIRKNIRKW